MGFIVLIFCYCLLLHNSVLVSAVQHSSALKSSLLYWWLTKNIYSLQFSFQRWSREISTMWEEWPPILHCLTVSLTTHTFSYSFSCWGVWLLKEWLFMCVNYNVSFINYKKDYFGIKGIRDPYVRDKNHQNQQFSRFVCLCILRPDRGSGWEREDVWMGSLTTDHLLQKSRKLQDHSDTIQPPRK